MFVQWHIVPYWSLSDVVFLHLLFALQVSSLCYLPDGDSAPDDTPCDPSASVSMCCNEGWKCYTKDLCTGPYNILKWGSCTDKTWNSRDCPQICQKGTFDMSANPLTRKPDIQVLVSPLSKAVYCSEYNAYCCDNGQGAACCGKSNLFEIKVPFKRSKSSEGTLPLIISYPSASSDSPPLMISFPSASSDLSTSFPLGSAATLTAPSAPSGLSSSSTTRSESSTSAVSKSPDPESNTQNASTSSNTKIGLGVGVTVGCIVLATSLLFYFLRRYRKKQRHKEEQHRQHEEILRAGYSLRISEEEGILHELEAPSTISKPYDKAELSEEARKQIAELPANEIYGKPST